MWWPYPSYKTFPHYGTLSILQHSQPVRNWQNIPKRPGEQPLHSSPFPLLECFSPYLLCIWWDRIYTWERISHLPFLFPLSLGYRILAYVMFFKLLHVFVLFCFEGVYCLFWSGHRPCGILVMHPEMEPTPSALEAWSINHCTTREVLSPAYF